MEDKSKIILYQPEETFKLEVRLESDTVWLKQQQMAELFQTSKQNISLHTNNVFKEKELQEISTVKYSLTVQQEGNRKVKRNIAYYNLDVIISVGYRVKSQRGTDFRIWAVNQRMEQLEQRVAKTEEKIDFFVRTPCPRQKASSLKGRYSMPTSLPPI